MIKPANGLMILGNSDGKSDVLSLDLLEEDLSFAIAENRYTNQELIDSVIELVNVFLAARRVQNEPISLTEVDKFVVRLLINVGLSNVAGTLCEQRKINDSQFDLRHTFESVRRSVIKQREIPFLVGGRSACLIHQGALSIKPISLLLLLIQISINIDRFIKSLSSAPAFWS